MCSCALLHAVTTDVTITGNVCVLGLNLTANFTRVMECSLNHSASRKYWVRWNSSWLDAGLTCHCGLVDVCFGSVHRYANVAVFHNADRHVLQPLKLLLGVIFVIWPVTRVLWWVYGGLVVVLDHDCCHTQIMSAVLWFLNTSQWSFSSALSYE